MPTPAWENRPHLYEDLWDVWTAFGELSDARTSGFGPNPIAWDQMLAWFGVRGIEDLEVRDTYCQLIRAMDRVFLEHVYREAADGKSGKSGAGG